MGVSIDRLKPAHIDQTHPPNVAEPPRRGRPPKPPSAQTNQPTERPAEQESLQQTVPDRPSYAEVTTRSGRTTKVPQRYLTRSRSTQLGLTRDPSYLCLCYVYITSFSC